MTPNDKARVRAVVEIARAVTRAQVPLVKQVGMVAASYNAELADIEPKRVIAIARRWVRRYGDRLFAEDGR